jgi:hypothetical protein
LWIELYTRLGQKSWFCFGRGEKKKNKRFTGNKPDHHYLQPSHRQEKNAATLPTTQKKEFLNSRKHCTSLPDHFVYIYKCQTTSKLT